jgi:hypothetical protein
MIRLIDNTGEEVFVGKKYHLFSIMAIDYPNKRYLLRSYNIFVEKIFEFNSWRFKWVDT